MTGKQNRRAAPARSTGLSAAALVHFGEAGAQELRRAHEHEEVHASHSRPESYVRTVVAHHHGDAAADGVAAANSAQRHAPGVSLVASHPSSLLPSVACFSMAPDEKTEQVSDICQQLVLYLCSWHGVIMWFSVAYPRNRMFRACLPSAVRGCGRSMVQHGVRGEVRYPGRFRGRSRRCRSHNCFHAAPQHLRPVRSS